MAALVRRLNKSQCMILKNILKNNNGLSRMVMSTQVDLKAVNGHAAKTKYESQPKLTSHMIFEREDKYGAHNYHPLPVALCKGKGTKNENFLYFNCYLFIRLNYFTLIL